MVSCPRFDDEVLDFKVSGVNEILQNGWGYGWGYVDHSTIFPEHDLNRSGLHLNTKEDARLATNFIDYFIYLFIYLFIFLFISVIRVLPTGKRMSLCLRE